MLFRTSIDLIYDLLTEFSVNSVTEGIDALGEVTIRIENSNGITFTGTGSDPDIVVASAKAYLNAINRSIQMTKEGSESPGSGAGRSTVLCPCAHEGT